MSEIETPRPTTWSAWRIVKLSLVLLGLCGLILLGAGYAYDTAWHDESLRTDCLIAIMVAGVGATVCLAGITYLLDRPLVAREGDGDKAAPWYTRVSLGELKRVLMVLELVTIGVSLAAAAILIFGFKLPG